ncbi:MAG: endo alpha-1,4 polygalactosaminidase [Candidatus Nanopelagicales bacterium]
MTGRRPTALRTAAAGRVLAVLAVVVLLASGPLASGPTYAAERPAPAVLPGQRLWVQLSGSLRIPAGTDAVELDGEDTPARTVRRLRAYGLTVVCYVSAGSWERYRDDAGDFPRSVLGRRLDGWPDERWLDVRRLDVLLPLIERRVRTCADKGFRGVEFDNVDGYANRTGFPITRRDQLRYDRALAALARRHGLSPGLKNSPGLVADLVASYDWALVEECVTYDECARYRPFVRAAKSVTVLEYGDVAFASVCRAAARLGVSAELRRRDLGPWVRRCR